MNRFSEVIGIKRGLIGIVLMTAACQAALPAPSPTGVPGVPDGTASPAAAAAPSPAPAAAAPSPAPATAVPALTGQVVFHRRAADGIERYFTIRPDGSDERALFETEGCVCAHWSFDGSQILSIGPTPHGTLSLLTMEPDGSNQTVLDPPDETLNLFVGASSADGRVIVFQGMDETNPARNGLYVASPDLSDVRLVMASQAGWLAVEPFGISEDGSIVFFVDTGAEGGTTHAGDVYVIDDDATGLRQLNPAGVRLGYLDTPAISLSPDGRQAAFGVGEAVHVVDLEGGEARAITPRTGFVWAVSWSPTGEWISYTRVHDRTPVVSLVRPDGTDDHEVSEATAAGAAELGAWSPDGRHLLVRHAGDLWVMDLEGTLISQVTHQPSTYGTYSWAPAPGP